MKNEEKRKSDVRGLGLLGRQRDGQATRCLRHRVRAGRAILWHLPTPRLRQGRSPLHQFVWAARQRQPCHFAGDFEFIRLNPTESECSIFFRIQIRSDKTRLMRHELHQLSRNACRMGQCGKRSGPCQFPPVSTDFNSFQLISTTFFKKL